MSAEPSRLRRRLAVLVGGDPSLAGMVVLNEGGGVAGVWDGDFAAAAPRWLIQLSDRRSTFVGGWLCRVRHGAALVGWGVAPTAAGSVRAARRAARHRQRGGACCEVCGAPHTSVYVGHNVRRGRCAAHELRHEAAAVYIRDGG